MPLQPPWTHDRRRALRVEVPAHADVDVTRPDGAAPVTLRQISLRGMIVEGQVALTPESPCDVQLAVDGFRTLTLAGFVVYSRAAMALDTRARVRFASAVAFEALPAEVTEELTAIVGFLGGGAEAGEAG